MKTLPTYAKPLLLQGASTLGNFTEGYFFVEERLQAKHAALLLEFCKWIDEKVGGASGSNIDMLFSAFRNPGDEKLKAQVEELASLIELASLARKTRRMNDLLSKEARSARPPRSETDSSRS